MSQLRAVRVDVVRRGGPEVLQVVEGPSAGAAAW